MRDSIRRFLLFFGTVTLGTLFIFIDLPVFYILLITFLFGVIFLFLTGSLSLSNLRRGKDLSGDQEKKKIEVPKGPTFREKFAEKAPSFYNLYLKTERLFSPLGRAASGIKGRFIKPTKKDSGKSTPSGKEGVSASIPEKKRFFEGLRARLSRKKDKVTEVPAPSGVVDKKNKTSSDDAAAGPIEAGSTSGAGGGGDDPFGDISLEDMDEELFSELGDDESVSGLKPIDSEEDLNRGGGIEIDSGDMMDDVASILAQEGGFADEEFSGEELSPEMDLDSIDLDALDIDEDLDDIDDLTAEPSPIQEATSYPEEEEEEVTQTQEEPETRTITSNEGYQFNPDKAKTDPNLASFGGADSDILNSLKSDARLIKKDLDISLVRDLKDVIVTTEEIEEELSSVLIALGGKKTDVVSPSDTLVPTTEDR
ncbi:MAG: LapA family protein [Methanocalculus sp.]|uniref:LapA family protein n=1 Tax=Methanocalculus sp. TaxID=2004547 RepID=UPI00271D99CB|nr:LapA family protein [Methanocalculus sp.]MDO9539800.1 LapA family protein [Methanocalculus sp.]